MESPKIELLSQKHCVGMSFRMSLIQNKTAELWKSFMAKRESITGRVSSDLISLQVYDSPDYFTKFDPNKEFTKYALAEIIPDSPVPSSMKEFILSSGLYAVFIHRGTPLDFGKTIHYIFQEWLPNSGYKLEHRPHFELLGSKYKNNDPTSEEEIWIPIVKV
nr:GyrI-like domain-containing protein [Leptospira noguchii]